MQELEGQALATHDLGPRSGDPVLALHGVTGYGGRWRAVAADALPGRRVLAVDLRGHGDSTWDPPWSTAQHVADLLATLDAHEVARVDVVAHSFGGLLALALLEAVPERVGRLALLDPAVALGPERARARAEEACGDVSWESVEAARIALRAGYHGAARAAAEADVDEHVRAGADGRFRERYSRPAVIAAWGEMARGVPRLAPRSGPVLLLTARDSDIVTDALRESLRRDAADLTEHVLPGGHRLYWEATAATAAHLRGFLTPA